MKKLIWAAVLVPSTLFAVPDVSNCEKIAHRVNSNTIEKCTQKPSICDIEPNSNKCQLNIKTAEECSKIIEQENITIPRDNYIVRCPADAVHVAMRSGAPDAAQYQDWVYTDGTALNFDDLIADDSNVYFLRMPPGIIGFLRGLGDSGGEHWYVITDKDANGLFLIGL